MKKGKKRENTSIASIIDGIFGAVWNVISGLSLHLALTVGAVWVVLIAFLPEKNLTSGLNTTFLVLMCLSLIYAAIVTAVNFVRYLKNKPTKKRKVTVDEIAAELSGKPKYYKVAQNPNYIMAEYPDRYELYYNDNGELKFVKMNLKKGPDPKEDDKKE